MWENLGRGSYLAEDLEKKVAIAKRAWPISNGFMGGVADSYAREASPVPHLLVSKKIRVLKFLHCDSSVSAAFMLISRYQVT